MNLSRTYNSQKCHFLFVWFFASTFGIEESLLLVFCYWKLRLLTKTVSNDDAFRTLWYKINKYHMLLLNEKLVSLKHKILFYVIWGVFYWL